MTLYMRVYLKELCMQMKICDLFTRFHAETIVLTAYFKYWQQVNMNFSYLKEIIQKGYINVSFKKYAYNCTSNYILCVLC